MTIIKFNDGTSYDVSQITEKITDPDWMESKEQAIREMLPSTWTHIGNLDNDQIADDLQAILEVGTVPYKVLRSIMEYFADIGIALRKNGFLIRRNDTSIFPRPED